MSLTLNMVGGGSGGGSLKNTDAILSVTVAAGATVTATRGSTTLTPVLWTKAADSNLDCAVFIIPSNLFSSTAWTVSATISGTTTSGTIVIDSAKEYELTFYGTFIVFDSTHTTTVNDLTKLKSGTDYSFSLIDNNTKWGKTQIRDTSTGALFYYMPLDLTGFKTMLMTYNNVRISSYGGGHFGMYVMNYDTSPTLATGQASGNYQKPSGAPATYEATDRLMGSDYTSNAFTGTFTIDLTPYTGIHYIGVGIGRYSVGAGARYLECHISEWKLVS